MSQAIPHTHAAKATLSLNSLAQWITDSCDRSDIATEVRKANTARQAFDMIRLNCPGVIERVGYEIIKAARHFSGDQVRLQSIILDYEGRIVFDSDAGRGGGVLL
jgi:cobalt-precorrin-5B (C1)-methyltransferase